MARIKYKAPTPAELSESLKNRTYVAPSEKTRQEVEAQRAERERTARPRSKRHAGYLRKSSNAAERERGMRPALGEEE